MSVMSEANDMNVDDKLRRLIESIDVAAVLTEPLTHAIEDLLRMSSADVRSAEASVLIRDGDAGDLKFLTAIGEVAEQLLTMKIPAGKGIAGFVLSSGQPMAVSDVAEENTFYAEVDKATGFSTQSILATPLRHDGEIIGVLEYINRPGPPPFEPFTPAEMDRAAQFADAIAGLVNAFESARLFRELGDKIISDDTENAVEVRNWLKDLRESAEHREMMDLAMLIREVASRGDLERRLCRDVLEALLNYSDSRSATSFLSF